MWHLLSIETFELARCWPRQSAGTTAFLARTVVWAAHTKPATKMEMEESEGHDPYARRHAQLSRLARLQNLFTLH